MDHDVRMVKRVMAATEREPWRFLTIGSARWLVFLFVPLILLADLLLCGNVLAAVTVNSAVAFAIAQLLSLLLGALVYRKRPFAGHAFMIRPRIKPPLTLQSFPSSHAAAAFALATTLTSWNPVAGAVGFVLALTVSLGRIAVGVHYFSDILSGALIGILSALAVNAYGLQIVACTP